MTKTKETIFITETPRDAMQGLSGFIPTITKTQYINLLLKCGFDCVDVGSFVSPKAVPQMADTSEVISLLNPLGYASKMMVIVGNVRGANQSALESKVKIMGFPYSVSGSFLKKNLNTTPELAWQTVLDLRDICELSQKELRVYVTMAFGNPYGDAWNDEIVLQEVEKLYNAGIRNLVFSDITGEGTPGNIERLCSLLINSFPESKLGIHLHSKPYDWQPKVEAAWSAGIRNFEGALGGFGGCPMTGYELLGNLDTLRLIDWCEQNQISHNIVEKALHEARHFSTEVFKHQ